MTQNNQNWKAVNQKYGIATTINEKWANITKISNKMTKMLQEIQHENNKLIKEIRQLSERLSTDRDYYTEFVKTMMCFSDMIEVYNKNYQNNKHLFESLANKVSEQAHKKWEEFVVYEKDIFKTCSNYRRSRS